ncbi:MAG: transglycosylase domain-containing protein [Candidatus Limnocylindrales bacterium]|nr:transglycosylase domain-containing protein [Candidatus Limnocylindrales bacterium]
MQTSVARRQRHRRAIGRRPSGRRGTTVATVVGAILAVLLVGTILVAFVGLLVVVGAYNHYAAGLPLPAAALNSIQFEQQTIVYDRTGKIELARLGDLKRELVEFDEIPGEVLDSTTAIEDKDFWTNAGFDPFAIISAGIDTVSGRPRGASTITQQLVRQRLLPPEAFEGSTYERKIREIIQSIRLTEAFPGQEGKEQIITAYLNQNFYGNQSYGVKAAARSYFGKSLDELTLAQAAILAAIPQSPTRFDLVRNAESVCLEDVPEGAECTKFKLVVPPETEIVLRRNHILDLMKTRSPLTGDKHSAAQYEAAKDEPVDLQQQVSINWKAPHFVWQVRRQLGEIFCPDSPDDCPKVDSGGYRVTTTLDWEMQKVAEKWVYVSARAPNAKDPRAVLTARKIPKAAQGWILGLRGHDLNNAAAAVMDYRTGEVLAYVGSASYTSKGNKTFQPQFDVLADGWRQPGSAIKPIDYLIGIDDKALTASTMLMDVVTDFGNEYTPTQADKLERGPVRVRSALQFSLNIPAIKATVMTGLDRVFARTKDFGLTYPNTAIPVVSMGIGTLELHPIDLLGAFSTIADGGVRVPRRAIQSIVDADGNTVWPLSDVAQKGARVVSSGAAYIITDILAGNTDTKLNPYWGKWAIYDGDARRPAAYKTGTTSDNRDVAAYGYLAPPANEETPALAVGVWMGNSDNSPNDGKLSLDTSAPLWSAILTEISQGLPIADFVPPSDLETAEVDAFTGLKPGPFTTEIVEELFVPGTVPTQEETSRVALRIDEASGLLWQEGCAGPEVTRGFFDLSEVEASHESWQKANAEWGARAARGAGVRGGPEGTRTSYFYNNSFAPFGRSWGAPFAPTALCPIVAVICDPFIPPDPNNPFPPNPQDPFASPEPACIPLPTESPAVEPTPEPRPTREPKPTKPPRN